MASEALATTAGGPPRHRHPTAKNRQKPPSRPPGPARAARALKRQLRHHRHMVGGLVPAADVAMDRHARQAIGRLRREQQMVDADAVVTPPGAGLVVPEGVAPGAPSAAM